MVSPFLLVSAILCVTDVISVIPIKMQDRMQSIPLVSAEVENCQSYRLWQTLFNKRKRDVIEGRVDYLSWNEFVALKQGNVRPELETFCEGK